MLGVTISDKPGRLASIASIFARSHAHIEYMYASAVAHDQQVMVIVHVANPIKGERALRAAKVI